MPVIKVDYPVVRQGISLPEGEVLGFQGSLLTKRVSDRARQVKVSADHNDFAFVRLRVPKV